MTTIGFTQLKEKANKYPNNKEIANTIKVITAEMTNRFNWKNYVMPNKFWNGINIQTQALFCSYGQIGYTACGDDILPFSYDWDKLGYIFDIDWDDEWEAMQDLPDEWDEKGIDIDEWKKKYHRQEF